LGQNKLCTIAHWRFYGRLANVKRRYPAHYIMVDDKLRVLAAMKRSWQDQLTTIFPRQGHYACDPKIVAAYPAPDITVDRIGHWSITIYRH